MLEIDKFKLKKIKEDGEHGEYEIGPLPKGFGHTVANSLRRILLSSIEGAAVVGVKLNGVDHEYSSLEGVQDDVLAILLNIKELAIVSHTQDDVVLKLSKKGKKGDVVEITAKDIEPNADVEIVNKDLVITTLSGAASKIDAEIRIKRGIGYAYPDESIRKEIGNLPIDANFNPVVRVEYQIAQARVGQRTDYDLINLNITTNKVKTPAEVLLEAAEIYDMIANKLVNIFGGDSDEVASMSKESTKEEDGEKIKISEVSMSTRLTNSLMNAGIATLNELDSKDYEEVENYRGMGSKSFEELNEILTDFGFSLKK
ncbi:DNA-directed RNA polymerase subunit alpha [Candidatus Dojkabacteria bacterium]|nr:DNA-directed RNA polymerase subunit alpha [Candidatus Dojkabacteria bacterium]